MCRACFFSERTYGAEGAHQALEVAENFVDTFERGGWPPALPGQRRSPRVGPRVLEHGSDLLRRLCPTRPRASCQCWIGYWHHRPPTACSCNISMESARTGGRKPPGCDCARWLQNCFSIGLRCFRILGWPGVSMCQNNGFSRMSSESQSLCGNRPGVCGQACCGGLPTRSARGDCEASFSAFLDER